MVIWKEREHEVPETQAVNDPATIEALQNYGILKYFRILGIKEHVWLLEYIINMWDPDQKYFVVGVHILPIEIEDIYFLAGLSMRRSLVVLFGAQGGEGSLDDIINQHCSLRSESQ